MNFGNNLKNMVGLPLTEEDQIPFIAMKRKAEEIEAEKQAALKQKQDLEKKQS
ncbi:hypothetical protein [Thiobacillus sp.]|uniref:hypothetical protein n=1 Tax=Thiobacillus sp. TaxID=924 RepID=UPI0025EEB4BB|nr:hypothetical protein [Thiobacillus sp.]MBT9540380.1 hypothetical protein [Thiobacillus sp.]